MGPQRPLESGPSRIQGQSDRKEEIRRFAEIGLSDGQPCVWRIRESLERCKHRSRQRGLTPYLSSGLSSTQAMFLADLSNVPCPSCLAVGKALLDCLPDVDLMDQIVPSRVLGHLVHESVRLILRQRSSHRISPVLTVPVYSVGPHRSMPVEPNEMLRHPAGAARRRVRDRLQLHVLPLLCLGVTQFGIDPL